MPEINQVEIGKLLQNETKSLVGFLTMLTGNRHVADDLFQETCLEILRIYHKYDPQTDFGAWARGVARFQVLRHWRKQGRDKLLFSSDMMDQLAESWSQYLITETETENSQQLALQACLKQLKPSQREILSWRYRQRCSYRQISERLGRTIDAAKMLVCRLHKKLRLCVEIKVNDEQLQRLEG